MPKKISKKNPCSACHIPCCSARSRVGDRFVTAAEIKRIEAAGYSGFYVKKPEFSFYTLRNKDNGKACIFFDAKNGVCTIYDVRPADCRFYPYDIIQSGGKYCWIKWQSSDCAIHMFLDDEKMLEELERDVIPGFRSALKDYADYTKYIIAGTTEKFAMLRPVKLRPE